MEASLLFSQSQLLVIKSLIFLYKPTVAAIHIKYNKIII
jgi:hypothetical protein